MAIHTHLARVRQQEGWVQVTIQVHNINKPFFPLIKHYSPSRVQLTAQHNQFPLIKRYSPSRVQLTAQHNKFSLIKRYSPSRVQLTAQHNQFPLIKHYSLSRVQHFVQQTRTIRGRSISQWCAWLPVPATYHRIIFCLKKKRTIQHISMYCLEPGRTSSFTTPNSETVTSGACMCAGVCDLSVCVCVCVTSAKFNCCLIISPVKYSDYL